MLKLKDSKMTAFLFSSKPLKISLRGFFFILLLSCNGNYEKQDKSAFTQIIPSKIVEVGYQISNKTTIIESEITFDNDLFQYHNNPNSIYIYDKKNHKYISVNYKGEIINSIEENTFYQIPFSPTSAYSSNGKVTFLFLNQLQVGKLEDDSLRQVILSEKPSEIIYSDRNRFEVLPNGNFIVAPAVNVLDQTSYYGRILNENLTEVLKKQYLFTIYDSVGHLIKQFGKFPQSNFVENPRLIINPYYYYVVKGDFIYVTFPMGKEVFKFSLDGELIEKFLIKLPDFNYETNDNENGSDTMAGFGIEKNSQDDILYFHTILKTDENRIKHKLYRLNMLNKKLEHSEIMNGNNYMLPYIYSGQVSFLRKYIKKEDKDIYRLELTSRGKNE